MVLKLNLFHLYPCESFRDIDCTARSQNELEFAFLLNFVNSKRKNIFFFTLKRIFYRNGPDTFISYDLHSQWKKKQHFPSSYTRGKIRRLWMIVCLPQPTMFIIVPIHKHNANCSRGFRAKMRHSKKTQLSKTSPLPPSRGGWTIEPVPDGLVTIQKTVQGFFQHPGGCWPVTDRSLVNNKKRKRDRKFRCKLDMARDDQQPVWQMLVQLQFVEFRKVL